MKNYLRTGYYLFLSCLLSTTLLRAQTPLTANGRLQVINRQLCNEAGAPTQLRGMSTHGLHWFPSCFTASSVQTLATDWGCDVFRAAMYIDEGGYVNNPAGLRAKINEIVDWTAAAGIYCVIDWHILNPGNPNLHLAEAKDFFRTMAQTHAGKKHVIYELCNEPNGVDWPTIKSYAEAVIPEIRQYDPTAIILVGTPNYSGTPGDVRGNMISGSLATNLMYTFHFYAGSHFSQNYINEVLQTVPLFISEWGTSNFTGNGGDNYANAQTWVDLMAGANPSGIKVSWCNWNFSDKNESSAALVPGACSSGAWNNTSTSGTWVKQHILAPADSWAGTPPPPSFTPLPARTLVGYWQNWNDANFINLRDVPARYNVVNVSFLETQNSDGYTATFAPTAPYTEASFRADVQTLKQRGTPVIISIGGQNGVVKLNTVAQKNTFVQTVRQIIDRYGFDGIDLDLEGSSMTYGGNNPDFRNPTQAATLNLIAAVRELKTAYGSGFIISAAPETYYVQTGYSAYTGTAGAFLPVLYNIRDILNYVQVQLYNTGSMVALNGQIYSSATADFIVSMTDMLLRGFPVAGTGQTFPALRPDQVAIGLPACTSAAGSGYTPPAEVLKALDYLTKGIAYGGTYATTGTYPGLRGMMTWSVNWDKQGCGRPTYEFVNTYWDYFFGTPGTPSITLTSPAANATFTAPASIPLAASVANASPTKVEFYQGSTKLGEDLTAPYAFSWTNVPAGSYSLTAKAILSSGGPLNSAAVNVTVSAPGNQLPGVSLTAPANNASFTAPASIALSANASDGDGTVSKVEFFQGNTKLGEDLTAPYEFTWSNVAAGSYALTAKATDNLGAMTTSATVNVSVNGGTPPGGTGDILGPDCVALNSVVNFEINASNRNNVSSYSAWWSNGSAVSITNPAGQPWKAMVSFGAGFTGGELCVGVNYSVAPWYKQFCKTVTVCTGNPPPTNQAPSVSLTAPANNASFTASASIALSANASDGDGTVSK
ncbi:MAG: cellulase family glycosylhydrolase, partial [Cytophagaceae bacterium]|nr:cellulase family glycosylhydrolase [Cytophagaceae bacterium]